jgi:hypothetical protein
MLFPLLLLATGGWFGHKAYKRYTALTPAREEAFRMAMNAENADPARLRALAAAFEKVGLDKQAKLLRQRAALKEAPPEVKAKRQALFQSALNSKDPDAILKIAAVFEENGATGAAENLRMHAESVKAVGDA